MALNAITCVKGIGRPGLGRRGGSEIVILATAVNLGESAIPPSICRLALNPSGNEPIVPQDWAEINRNRK